MTKEEVKVADITKVSAENIEEVINNGSTVTEDVAKAAEGFYTCTSVPGMSRISSDCSSLSSTP